MLDCFRVVSLGVVCLRVCLFVRLRACVSVRFVCLWVCGCVDLWVCACVCVCVFVCLFVFVCLSLCLCICLVGSRNGVEHFPFLTIAFGGTFLTRKLKNKVEVSIPCSTSFLQNGLPGETGTKTEKVLSPTPAY